jgi:hypothetical protein
VKTGSCDPRDLQLSGSLGTEGFKKYTSPQNSGQDFAPSQVESVIMRGFLTNILKSQAMLLRAKGNAPTTTRGEFEHRRACVLGVIAPAPVRHALSNNRRAD